MSRRIAYYYQKYKTSIRHIENAAKKFMEIQSVTGSHVRYGTNG
jgi:hypothetical protein